MTHEEKLQFYKIEKEAQSILDKWYMSRGHSVDRSTSCKLYDCIIDGSEKVEEKIRGRKRDDIVIEVIQDVTTNSLGWYFETGCDYLHYVFMDSGVLHRIKWIDFKNWWESVYLIKNKQGSYIVSPRGWGTTINLVVPISFIPSEILFTYNFMGIDT